MLEIEVRRGTADDASRIADRIKEMLLEMENYRGYPLNPSPQVWAALEKEVRANCSRQDYIYLLAALPHHPAKVIGIAAAYVEPLEDLFIPWKRLHVSAIYTDPNVRRSGVAARLLHHLIDFGQQMGAEEVDLNVLVENPALHLYEQLGFKPREISMVRSLRNGSGEPR